MPDASKRLGIIAGGGELPLAIARAAKNDGREVFVLALEGMANDKTVDAFPHAWASLGEFGKLIGLLKEAECSEIIMAGKVVRPEIHRLKLDARGALALPRVLAAAVKGDDALLRALIGLLEKEGIHVIGSAEAARDLLAAEGPLGQLEPTEDEQRDILHGIRVVRALGELDIGQAAVVCRGLVLAVEAAEGTDAMLIRAASLPQALRGTPDDRKGALVKALKPRQERRVDLPTIGPKTVELASAAGLAGIAVQGGHTLIIDRTGVAEAADRLGMFVYGFSPEDYRG